MDTNEIERTVSILRDNYSVLVKEASDALTSEIKKLNQWALLLWGTETYTDFYKIIVKHFGDLDEKEITPGTIGSLCYGCNLSGVSSLREDGARSCAPTCFGSIPPSGIPQWVGCEAGVSLLYRDQKGSYRWKDLQKAKQQTTYIFFMDDTIAGAKPIDYAEIAKRGITKYSLYQYKNGNYFHLRSDSVVRSTGGAGTFVETMQTNGSGHLSKHFDKEDRRRRKNKSNGLIFAIIFLIILIIIACVFFMLSYRKSGKTSKRRTYGGGKSDSLFL